MASRNSICKLCCDKVKGRNLQSINENIQDMLQLLLIDIDISSTENAVICNTCHSKLENGYYFKKKCIFTEDSLKLFVAENEILDLNEIRNQIIKSEGVETEKNICRLCLEACDEMTLTEDEKMQFQGYFPEINLNLTNLVLLCLVCYNTLQKYFMFVMNAGKAAENIVLNGGMGIKREYSSDLLEEQASSMDISIEQINGIKSEDDNDQNSIIHEELSIKSDGDSYAEECVTPNLDGSYQSENNDSPSKAVKKTTKNKVSTGSSPKKNSNSRKKDANSTTNTNTFKTPIYKCEQCHYQFTDKYNLKYHSHIVLNEPSTSKMYKCDNCDYETRWRWSLKTHNLNHNSDHSKIQTYKCDRCNYESKVHANLKRHFTRKHSPKVKT